MQAWANRQIDDNSEYLTGEIDFISLSNLVLVSQKKYDSIKII